MEAKRIQSLLLKTRGIRSDQLGESGRDDQMAGESLCQCLSGGVGEVTSPRASWRRQQATWVLALCRGDVRACPVYSASSAQVQGLLPSASHRTGVRCWFPIMTSVSDDLSSREARASWRAGWEGGRALDEGRGGALVGHAPIRQRRPMGAADGSPPP